MTPRDRYLSILSDAEVLHWFRLFGDWPPKIVAMQKARVEKLMNELQEPKTKPADVAA